MHKNFSKLINNIQNKNQIKAVEIIEIILEMMEIIQIVVQVVGLQVLMLVVEIKIKTKKERTKKHMNQEIARLMKNQRVEYGSNVCFFLYLLL